jgi:hypothetical protein
MDRFQVRDIESTVLLETPFVNEKHGDRLCARRQTRFGVSRAQRPREQRDE